MGGLPSVVAGVAGVASLATPAVADAAAYQATVLADSPVVWYPLDDTAPPVANRSTVLGSCQHLFDGAPSGGVTLGAPGFVQPRATAFNGTDGVINIPKPGACGTGLPAISTFTLESWFNATSAFTARGYFGTVLGTTSGMGLDAGRVFGSVNLQNPTATLSVASTTTFNDGQWHYAAITDDGTTLSLYVDGVLNAQTGGLAGSLVFSSETPGAIGANGAAHFAGSLQDVGAYQAVLSPSRIAAHNAAGRAPAGGPVGAGEVPTGANASACAGGSGQPQSGAWPVNPSSGNFWHTFDDLSVAGRGCPLHLTHTYNSLFASTRPPAAQPWLGFGWTWSYGMVLTDPAGNALGANPTQVVLHQEDGAQVAFVASGGTFSPTAPRFQATLSAVPGGYAVVRNKVKTLSFDAAGRLTAMADLNAETTTITFPSGSTMRITDASHQRWLTITFDPATGHITQAADGATNQTSAARSVSFAYVGDDLSAFTYNGFRTDLAGATVSDTVTLTYEGSSHRLSTMVGPANAALTPPNPPKLVNTYDPATGRVLSQADPDNRMTRYCYGPGPCALPGGGTGSIPADATAGLTSTLVTDAAGNATLYSYASGVLVAMTRGYASPDAATWSYASDAVTTGRTETVDPNGHKTMATYDPAGNQLSATDALGQTTVYTYVAATNRIATVTPPALYGTLRATTTLSYDEAGYSSGGAANLTTVAAPVFDPAGTQQGTATTHYFHDTAGHPGDVTRTQDPRAKIWTQAYDSFGNLAQSQAPARPDIVGGPAQAHITLYGYDTSKGWLTTQVSPRGQAAGVTAGCVPPALGCSAFGHDGYGHTLVSTDALGHSTSSHFDANGRLDRSVDGDNNATGYSYDPADQLILQTRADTSVLRTTYHPDGTVASTVDGATKPTLYDYDAQARLIKVTDPDLRYTNYGYDPAGNAVTKADPGGTCPAWPISYPPVLAGGTHCSVSGYDAANQLSSITYSDGATNVAIGYDADGRRTSMTDTANSTWGWDSLGRLRSSSSRGATVGYDYDVAGNLTTLTYPGGTNTVTKAYYDDGELHTVSDWLAHTTTYTPDADANMATQAYPNATTAIATFDPADRLMSVHDTPTGQPNNPLASFDYGRTNGDLVSSVTPTGVAQGPETYQYSHLNQLSTVQTPVAAPAYSYDTADNLKGLLDAGTQSFDPANQLTSAGGAVPPTVYGTTNDKPVPGDYNGDGTTDIAVYRPSTGQWLVKGISDTVYGAPGDIPVPGDYNGDGKIDIAVCRPSTGQWLVRGISETVWGQSGDVPVPGDYNGDGKTDIAVWRPSNGTWYLRGQAEEVLGTTGDVPVPARYDRDAKTDVAIFHPSAAATWTVKPSTAGGFGYDTRGNRTSMTPTAGAASAYGYDQANRLVTAPGPSSYTYRGDGLRMSKTVAGLTKAFTWDESGGLPMVLSDGDNSYVYGAGGLPLEQIDAAGKVLYFHQDQAGSTRLLTNAAGNVVATFSYDPYGNPTSRTGSATTPLGYAGQYTDAETGFQHLRARYYDPVTGQFLSRDPLVAQTQAPYRYAGADPLNHTDPSGFSKCSSDWWNPGGWTDCAAKISHSVVDPFMQAAQAQRAAGQPRFGPDPLSIEKRYPGLTVLGEHPDSVACAVSLASPTPGGGLAFPAKSVLRLLLTQGIDGGPVGGCGSLVLKALHDDPVSNSSTECLPPARPYGSKSG